MEVAKDHADEHLALPDISLLDLLLDLQTRANILIHELNEYQEYLRLQKQEKNVEIRVFKRGVESEVKGLRDVEVAFQNTSRSDDATTQEATPHAHALKSSNLPFYESVWRVVKSCHGIKALSKKMYQDLEERSGIGNSKNIRTGSVMSPQRRKRGVLVDIVAENGLEWIKVSTLSEKRLLFEIAKEGWERYADFSDGSDDDSAQDQTPPDKSTRQLELVQVANALQAASKSARINFRHPKVRFVLPNIREGLIKDVDAFIADLRTTGVTVECADDFTNRPPTPFTSELLAGLMPSTTVSLTTHLNLDCTILLAIISDISHLRHDQISPDSHSLHTTYHGAIMRQIESEKSEPLLTNDLYPLLGRRHLYCTVEAATRMREIVECMGTNTERARAKIVLGEDNYNGLGSDELRSALGQVSTHPVPLGLALPIKVTKFEIEQALDSSRDTRQTIASADDYSIQSTIALRSARLMRLTPINASVFLYGWMHEMTTITSNRAVAIGLMKTINQLLDEDERETHGSQQNANGSKLEVAPEDSEEQPRRCSNFVGPNIHVCETARSLIGKAKGKISPVENKSGTS